MTTATLVELRADLRTVVTGLLKNRAWEAAPEAHDLARGKALMEADRLDNAGAEWMIRHLRPMPQKPRVYVPRRVEVPEGYYMIGDRRYRVRVPKTGKWKGFASVREQDRYDTETFLKGDERRRVLAQIAVDPTAAAAEYGKRTGRCGFCHRLLTDPESVDRGIGPECNKKH